MIPSENCQECGEKLTADEQLYLLDVCNACEATMWLPIERELEEYEHSGAKN